MSFAVQILDGVLSRVGKPERWIRGAMAARRRPGDLAPPLGHGASPTREQTCDAIEPGASCFCVLGAVRAAAKAVLGPAYHLDVPYVEALCTLADVARDQRLTRCDRHAGAGETIQGANDLPQRTHTQIVEWVAAARARLASPTSVASEVCA